MAPPEWGGGLGAPLGQSSTGGGRVEGIVVSLSNHNIMCNTGPRVSRCFLKNLKASYRFQFFKKQHMFGAIHTKFFFTFQVLKFVLFSPKRFMFTKFLGQSPETEILTGFEKKRSTISSKSYLLASDRLVFFGLTEVWINRPNSPS